MNSSLKIPKPYRESLVEFNGGISDDIRKVTLNEFALSKHFDIFTNSKKITPYRDFETDMNDGSTSTGMKQYLIKDYLYHSETARLFGLGQTAGGLTKIMYKNDAATGNWTIPSSSEGNDVVQNGCFVEYKSSIWGFQGTNKVFQYGGLSATPSITNNSAGTLGTSITSVAQGVIAKDDNLYLPYNNKLVRVTSGGTVNDAVLTLPSNFKITSVANYGNYLAIACAPISTFNGVSKVYLWNLTSPDVQETIDWGEGELRIIETIEGYLIGVTDRYLNNSIGAGRGSLIIQVYSSGTPQVLKEYFTQTLTGKSIPLSKTVKNNRLFFAAKIMTNTVGTEYIEGIWSFGRKNANSPFALSLDLINEHVNLSGIQAFGAAGNFFFMTHSGDGSIDKLNDSASFTFTSVLETQTYTFGDPFSEKLLQMISVATVPLSSGQSVTVKLKVDGDTSYTTVGVHDRDGKAYRDFYNLESDNNANFPTGVEYTFLIESTGGAEITGFSVQAQPLSGSITSST